MSAFFRVSVIFCLLLQVSAVLAATEPQSAGVSADPQVCIGYDPTEHSWGDKKLAWTIRDANCPAGYAIFGHGYVSGGRLEKASELPLEGVCCPLPAGVLATDEVYVETDCPSGYVVTGGRMDRAPEPSSVPAHYLLRCTQLNTKKYEMSNPAPAWRVGWDDEYVVDFLNSYFFGREVKRTTWSRIPLAIRYAFFRQTQWSWDFDGCIGYPFGSVLTGRHGASCDELVFSTISIRDDGKNTRLKVFPDCGSLSDPYDSNAACNDEKPD